jgi:hypothetical protein
MSELEELRIYCAAQEQGRHYFLPAVEQALGRVHPDRTPETRLIRLPKIRRQSSWCLAKGLIEPLRMKDPDGIISAVIGEREIPLLWIEMSVAVETFDHALQRFDSFVAAGKADIPFVKIEAAKRSSAEHGGQTEFDRSEPFRVAQQEFDVPCFRIEWTLHEGGTRAQTLQDYPSCPADHSDLASLVEALLNVVITVSSEESRFKASELLKTEGLPGWIQGQLKENMMRLPDLKPEDHGGPRFFRQDDRWCLKFNRLDRGMDPERGMAWFYRLRTGGRLRAHFSPGVRAGRTPGERLKEFAKRTGLALTEGQMRDQTEAAPSGWGRGGEITNSIRNSDLTRPGLAIFGNCESFGFRDSRYNGLEAYCWEDIVPRSSGGIGERKTSVKLFRRRRSEVSEDEVTYTTTRILSEAGYRILAASYPDAQGDFVVVDAAGGRSAKRSYPDIVASLPPIAADQGATVLIIECKKASKDLSKDVETLSRNLGDEAWAKTLMSNAAELEPKIDFSVATILKGAACWESPKGRIRRSHNSDFLIIVSDGQWELRFSQPKGPPPNLNKGRSRWKPPEDDLYLVDKQEKS